MSKLYKIWEYECSNQTYIEWLEARLDSLVYEILDPTRHDSGLTPLRIYMEALRLQ